MLRSTASLRHVALLGLIFPFALLAAACSDSANGGSDAGDGFDGGPGSDAKAGHDARSGDAKAGDAKSGGDARPARDASSPGDTMLAADATPGTDAPGVTDATPGTDAPPAGDAGSPVDTGVAVDAHAPDTGALRDAGEDSAPPIGPAAVNLGTAGDYVILAESAITNGSTSAVTGKVGISPAAASYITGFAMTNAGTKWTSAQVVGGIFAADNDPPTPTNLTTAVGDMQTAYTDAAGRPTPGFLNLAGGAIGGLTLTPGLYKWTSNVTVPADITIAGGPNDEWIFQITGNLEMSAAMRMTLSGGAQAKNIVWQVAGLVDLGTTSHAEGIMLTQTAITLETGASINGRLLAQTEVSISSSTVTAP
jgi:hypothetical protein